jgi:hypothetical protein
MSMTARERRMTLHLPLRVGGTDAKGGSFAESTRSLNISGGGVCFESHRKLQVGQRLTLSIELPEALRKHFGGQPVYQACAVVCRVESFEGETAARVGARFVGEAGS